MLSAFSKAAAKIMAFGPFFQNKFELKFENFITFS
jgi:hypothetical protein